MNNKNDIPTGLARLGLDLWLLEQVEPEKLSELTLVRVIGVQKDSFVVTNGTEDIFAELLGKLLYSAESALDYPAVGDWVLARLYDKNSMAIIHEVLPRKSLLKRKTSGQKVDFQLIAANIDTALIMQALDGNYNLRRLERYLAMVHEGNIEPVVLLSKSDLLSSTEVKSKIEEIKRIMPQILVQPFSNEDTTGLDDVKGFLRTGETYCLLGSSGVGKTTLLNNLSIEGEFRTKSVRAKDGKGRHITTSRQMIRLDNGAMIVDTPGMRELGNFSIQAGIEETFPEIRLLFADCQFKNCTHINEKGCAVLNAVKQGTISEKRYQNYLKMTRESKYSEMSYLEKRKKDKQFGKLVKNVMKHKKGRY